MGMKLDSLLAKSSDAKFHCFDFSTRAIDLIKSHPNYDPTRINAFVFDLTSPPPALSIKLSECSSDFDLAQDTSSHPVTQTVDLISCIFVFSALPPDKHQTSVQTLIEVRSFFSFGVNHPISFIPPKSHLLFLIIDSQAWRHNLISRLCYQRCCSTSISSTSFCCL